MEIEIPDIDGVSFVVSCHNCYGAGDRIDYDSYVSSKQPLTRIKCETCMGTGMTLTKTGSRLIKFLKDLGLEVKNEKGWVVDGWLG